MSKAEERYLECFQDGRVRNCNSKEAFLLGYHQAEKDLDVVSWVKEISGVKELSRAKEEALKAYPTQSIAANYDTINRRDAFEYGYLKAEKDLIDKAIGWIKEINNHHHIMRYSDSCEPPLSELTEWFKNYMKEENINSK